MKLIHGPIAAKLFKFKETHAIYKTRNNLDDPNFDEKNEYKDVLIEYIKENNIKYLLDLHVMANFRHQDICIGTGLGKNIHNKLKLLSDMENKFIENGFISTTIDDPFNAVYKHTVSATIAKRCKIPCFQIEINNKYVKNKYEEYALESVLNTIAEVVDLCIEDLENNKKD